ncbi:MAG: type 1 glutamine amidotransferase [Actinobacteria bacterium]|nr:type 1 glutamine amidotransferase [Actinomycetota bacterium]
MRKTGGVRVLAIVHQTDAGPGVFGDVIRERGGTVDQWMLPQSAGPPADPLGYDAVLVLGGSMNADEGGRHGWIGTERGLVGRLLEQRVPLMGICLGGQMVAAAAGAVPRRAARPEIGWHAVEVTEAGRQDPVLGPLAPRFEALQWHGYEFPLPPGAMALARSEVCLQAARIGELAWAIQFHPEVTAADALRWTADSATDPDAIRIGLDPTALALEIEAKIGAFNDLGRDLCGRWLDVAAAARGGNYAGSEMTSRSEPS